MRDELEFQIAQFAKMGSALYAEMTAAAVADYDAGGVVREFADADPKRGSLSTPAIRMLAAFHACALDGSAPAIAAHFPSCGGDGDARGAWRAAREFWHARPARIAELFNVTPQTNETARSMPLLGGALAVAAQTGLPLRVFEAGASAGLNLRFDRYRYEGDTWSWGNPESLLMLRNRTQSGAPYFLDADLRVAERAGCDLHPLDPSRAADRATLRSFVWADQLERFERLGAALKTAANVPAPVERDDMLAWIPRRAQPREGVATVVMHSIVLEHLGEPDRRTFVDAVEAAGERATSSAPFAWLRMEFDGQRIATSVTLWPAKREIPIAFSDGHGQQLAWAQPQ